MKSGFIFFQYLQILVFIVALNSPAQAQIQRLAEAHHSFGVQITPVLPSEMFRVRGIDIVENDVTFQIDPTTGYSAGAMIRLGISGRFAFHTGINYLNRGYDFTATSADGVGSGRVRITSYEIPLLAGFYVYLSEKLLMTHLSGFSMHFLPNHLLSRGENIQIQSLRRSWLMPAFTNNFGLEYRTDKAGYFFIGPSYQMFFNSIFLSEAYFEDPSGVTRIETTLPGTFFGMIFRYYFPITGN